MCLERAQKYPNFCATCLTVSAGYRFDLTCFELGLTSTSHTLLWLASEWVRQSPHLSRGLESLDTEFEVPVILGSVIAHEIGHLLLGLNSHSDTGIMQKRWERKQLQMVTTGNLLFTAAQGKLMQAEMQRRTRVQVAVD